MSGPEKIPERLPTADERAASADLAAWGASVLLCGDKEEPDPQALAELAKAIRARDAQVADAALARVEANYRTGQVYTVLASDVVRFITDLRRDLANG